MRIFFPCLLEDNKKNNIRHNLFSRIHIIHAFLSYNSRVKKCESYLLMRMFKIFFFLFYSILFI